MALVLKTILLLLFHLVLGQNTQDIEIILLPLWNAEDRSEVPLNFKAFDHSIELILHKNDKIIAPQFQVWKHSDADTLEELPELNKPILCHYLHKDNLSSAAISLCGEHGMYGLVFLKNITLEIMPLQSQEISFFDYIKRHSETLKEPHIVKRTYGSFTFFEDELKYYIPVYNHLRKEEGNQNEEPLENINKNNMNDALTLELALFFDETGYNLFSPFFDRNDEKILDMLLAYINGIQAVYHHPSLGIAIDISLVRLEIMQKQPEDLPHHDGERGKLLDSFCNYAKKNNPANEFNPNHWDMGLYVSGLDFYVMEGGQKNSATMGLAIVNGLCIEQYSCVIAELGVTNQFGKPFPSAGFTSIYVAAHEMGHNLGMHHDSTGNTCPKDGYIMSPSRGIYGETIWSECSREVAQKLPYTKSCLRDKSIHSSMNNLDHTKFFNLPGREWTAKKQCEMFLRDKDAMVATFFKACESLQCKTPHRNGYFFAGPALDGTYCASGKECRGGECKNILQIYPGLNNPSIEPGGWSEWKTGPCKSGCLLKSTGAQIRQRFCNTSISKNTEIDCQGLHFDIILCRDENLCNKKRKNINEFATLKCGEFSERLPELDAKSGGLQALHEPERPWMACAIFCRRKDIASYYTPRVELNDLGLDPYFPDGTWCHTQEGQNYFCRQHHCLPENFHFEKMLLNDRQNDDAEFSSQNALAREIRLNDQVIKYLSLGSDRLPFLTSFPYNIIFPQDENEWIDKDYIELIKPTEEIIYHIKKG